MKFKNFLPILLALPSVTIGVIAMYFNGIPFSIWGQNMVALIILGIISYLYLKNKRRVREINPFGITFFIIILLLLTFLDNGLDGVHRWVSVGPMKLNVASILLPVLMIELWRISNRVNWWVPMSITIAVSILLALQPDASQATGFIIPMILILTSKAKKNMTRYVVAGLLFAIAIMTWVFIDNLPPVDYVEEILSMVQNLGPVWFVLGIGSLVLLPLPFVLFPSKKDRLISKCVGIYFMIIIVSTLFGNFPVPLMGYGISPIIGYFIASTWLLNIQSGLSSYNDVKNMKRQ